MISSLRQAHAAAAAVAADCGLKAFSLIISLSVWWPLLCCCGCTISCRKRNPLKKKAYKAQNETPKKQANKKNTKLNTNNNKREREEKNVAAKQK